jgi:hypothetical protein
MQYDAAMRFSLKWLLVGMAYAALAAAALAAPHWGYRDLLRAVNFLALVYAMTVAIAGHGLRRHAAIGFATAVVLLMAIPALSANTPTDRIVAAIFPTANLEVRTSGRRPNGVTQADAETYTYRFQSTQNITVMLAGLAGLGVGMLAYRRVERD